MPKIVDRDLQRQTFASAATRLIARHGLEGVTMRAVAREAGLSYGALFHYFESKEDLLMHAVQETLAHQTQRLNDHESRFSGLEALEQLLVDDAVSNESSRETWRVWMAFQYQASVHQHFRAMNASLVAGWHERIRTLLDSAKSSGEIPANVDTELEASALWAYSSGIGQLGVLHPDAFPPSKQQSLITNYLARLRIV